MTTLMPSIKLLLATKKVSVFTKLNKFKHDLYG